MKTQRAPRKVNCVIEQKMAPTEVLNQLNNQFMAVELVPEALLQTIVAHTSGGNFFTRCESVASFRQSLLQGTAMVSPVPWLPERVQSKVLSAIEQAGLPSYCYENEAVTDALILDLFHALENKQSDVKSLLLPMIKSSEAKKLKQLKLALEANKNQQPNNNRLQLSADQKLNIRTECESLAWLQVFSQTDPGIGLLPFVWKERIEVWQELKSVFDDLSVISGLGYGLSKGFLKSHGWMNLVELHKVIKKLPSLQAVIRTMGRMKDCDGTPIVEQIAKQMSISFKYQYEVKTPWVPEEAKGITRSDSVSRMLPQEAVMLGHPILKKLWHARRSESALVSYAFEGTDLISEDREQQVEKLEDHVGKQESRNRGPMIICLDTSGSMVGTPENIAKALVLECLNVATKEKRACYIYLFGSQNEVEEIELSLTPEGLKRIITFLSMSFGGGTDAEGPLKLALKQSDKKGWEKADILLVSDGEFDLTSGLSRKINTRKEQRGLMVQGVLIGKQSSAMAKICDPLHHFSKWLDLQLNTPATPM
ncbi:MAG: hypothetical protein ACJAS1_005108 [Oleiphilaceae bacterium]|jgi:uncharacterized protein with von Willebrand factor type A (vWA) domain